MGHPYWPLFDLEVRTPRLTLVYPDESMLVEIVRCAERGIHDPATMPFGTPWTDAEPPEFQRSILQHHWKSRAELTSDEWSLPFAVVVDGAPVGGTSLRASQFPARRTFDTGSWLALDRQGQGLGKELRLAALTLGFDGLGAEVAETAAFHDNGPSNGVTRSLGYEPDGETRLMRRDVADRLLEYRMDRAGFDRIRRSDIEIVGLDPVLPLLGLA